MRSSPPVSIERSLGPGEVSELVELYETYGWWADREGLVPFYEACGFEDQDAIDRLDGGAEELRFLAYLRTD